MLLWKGRHAHHIGSRQGLYRWFARKLALAARSETLALFEQEYTTENKAGEGQFDPVTEADRAAEAAMRRLIDQEFPEHGITGEELADRRADSRYCWSLDPIDGTRSYLTGFPTWTTLIALLGEGEPLLGLIDAPRLNELYIGTAEGSVLESGTSLSTLKTSGCSVLSQARLSTTDPYLFHGSAAEAFERLRATIQMVRFGHDGYAYARLAAGYVDLVVECGLKSHDYNALIPVVRGAGGSFGDWNGGSDFDTGNMIAAATPELYEAAVTIMKHAL